MKRLIVAVVLFVACSSFANAFTPSSGLWYNPSESGRGFNIEIQNNTMAVASYVYSQSGTPIWYTSAGTFNEGTETFTGAFGSAVGGQCLGCPYVSPTLTGNAGGPMQIVFTSFERGTLYFQGGSTPIQHFNFGYNGKTGYFQGEWAFSFNVGYSIISGDWIIFNGYYTGSDGTIYSEGFADGDSSTIALGAYEPSLDKFFVVIDDGVGFTDSYIFSGDNSRMSGQGWIESTGTPISGNGSPAVGSRSLSPSELGVRAAANTFAVTKFAVAKPRAETLQQLERAIQTHVQTASSAMP